MRVAQNLNLGKYAYKKMLRKCYQKCVGLIIKIPYLRTSKLSKDWLDDILDIFFNYFNVIKGVFCFLGTRPTQNFYLV